MAPNASQVSLHSIAAIGRRSRYSVGGQGAVLFFAALLVRLIIALAQHAWILNSRAEMERAAVSLAQTGVLGNPYAIPTGPSAHVNPGYALILAAIFCVFGTSVAGAVAKVAFTILISSAQYALLPAFGRALRIPAYAAFGAGLFGALVPLNPYIEIHGDFENHLTAVLLLLLILWMERLSHRCCTVAESIALGLFCGVCTLITSVLLPLEFLALLWLAYRQFRLPGGRPAASLLSALLVLACLLPWGIRNQRELGKFILTRSNFPLEFYLANNDAASPVMLDNGAIFLAHHPLQNVAEAEKVRRLGEVEYNRQLLEQTKAWIRAHPARFVELCIERFWYTWMPVTPEKSRELVLRLMALLSVPGLVTIARMRAQSAVLLAVPLVVFPLPMYLIQVHLRYRYPLNFILLICDAVAVYTAAITLRRSRVRAIHEEANQLPR